MFLFFILLLTSITCADASAPELVKTSRFTVIHNFIPPLKAHSENTGSDDGTIKEIKCTHAIIDSKPTALPLKPSLRKSPPETSSNSDPGTEMAPTVECGRRRVSFSDKSAE